MFVKNPGLPEVRPRIKLNETQRLNDPYAIDVVTEQPKQTQPDSKEAEGWLEEHMS